MAADVVITMEEAAVAVLVAADVVLLQEAAAIEMVAKEALADLKVQHHVKADFLLVIQEMKVSAEAENQDVKVTFLKAHQDVLIHRDAQLVQPTERQEGLKDLPMLLARDVQEKANYIS